MRFIVVVGLIALAGCARERPAYYFKEDGSATQRTADIQYCRDKSYLAAGSQDGGLAGFLEHKDRRNAAFRMCMADKGYARR